MNESPDSIPSERNIQVAGEEPPTKSKKPIILLAAILLIGSGLGIWKFEDVAQLIKSPEAVEEASEKVMDIVDELIDTSLSSNAVVDLQTDYDVWPDSGLEDTGGMYPALPVPHPEPISRIGPLEDDTLATILDHYLVDLNKLLDSCSSSEERWITYEMRPYLGVHWIDMTDEQEKNYGLRIYKKRLVEMGRLKFGGRKLTTEEIISHLEDDAPIQFMSVDKMLGIEPPPTPTNSVPLMVSPPRLLNVSDSLSDRAIREERGLGTLSVEDRAFVEGAMIEEEIDRKTRFKR